MTKILTLLALLLGTSVEAQTVTGDRFRLNTGPCVLSSGSGSPEGVVTATCGMYIDTATDVWYTKWTGTGNTGWGVGHNANAQINGTLGVSSNTSLSGFVGHPSYASQLTNWRVTAAGEGDFRYLYTDELHAKLFIADLEQALAGGQIICKSVTLLGANFTNPASAGTAIITVKDLPSAENQAVFQSGDWIGVRTFSRSAGSLTIGETFGTVAGYADDPGGTQRWTYTRGTGANGGGMATSTVIQTEAIVIDYGVSGNGCHEINAIDGANGVNSPYNQTWKWTTSPIAANRGLTTRTGNLTGITGTSDEYGSILGTYSTGTLPAYIKASNTGIDLHGVNLTMYIGAIPRIKLDRSHPSLAIGDTVPTGYGTGTGIWMGMDPGDGVPKFRAGNPGGAGLFWDGSTLTVRGTGGSSLNQFRNSECAVSTEGFSSGGNHGLTETLSFGLEPWDLNDAGGTCYVTVSGTPGAGTQTSVDVVPSASLWFPVVGGNRYEVSAYFGVHGTHTAQPYIAWYDVLSANISNTVAANLCTGANQGGYYLGSYCRSGMVVTAPGAAVKARVLFLFTYASGGPANPYTFWTRGYFGEATTTQTELSSWGATGLTDITGGVIRTGTILANHIAAGTITATQIAAGTITATQIAAGTITATQIAASTITATQIAAGTITATQIAANTITAAKIAAGTITATEIAAGTITATELAANSVTAAKISVSTLSSITANIGSITAGSLNINGNFIVNSAGQMEAWNAEFHGVSDFAGISSTATISTSGSSADIVVFGGRFRDDSMGGGGDKPICANSSGEFVVC